MSRKETDNQLYSNSISLKNYFRELKDTDSLNKEEQGELARRAKIGDDAAMHELVKSNLKFVLTIAKEYQKRGFALEDLISEGNIGLIKAVSRFDEKKGYKFISYAVWWVRQSILQYIYENSNIVRLPVSKINAIGKLNRASDKLFQHLDREPTIDKLTECTDMTVEDITSTYLDVHKKFSIDKKISPDSDNDFTEILPGETLEDVEIKINTDALHQEMKSIMSTLKPREREILNMFFGLNGHKECSLKEIGEHFGMTNERIRQLKEGALRKLRSYSRSKKVQVFRNSKLGE